MSSHPPLEWVPFESGRHTVSSGAPVGTKDTQGRGIRRLGGDFERYLYVIGRGEEVRRERRASRDGDRDGAGRTARRRMRHVLNVLQSMGGKRIDECRSPEARALPTLDMALRRILREPSTTWVSAWRCG